MSDLNDVLPTLYLIKKSSQCDMAAFNYTQVVHSNSYSRLQPWGYVPLVICSRRQEDEGYH